VADDARIHQEFFWIFSLPRVICRVEKLKTSFLRWKRMLSTLTYGLSSLLHDPFTLTYEVDNRDMRTVQLDILVRTFLISL
jgi:hypothetical protein